MNRELENIHSHQKVANHEVENACQEYKELLQRYNELHSRLKELEKRIESVDEDLSVKKNTREDADETVCTCVKGALSATIVCVCACVVSLQLISLKDKLTEMESEQRKVEERNKDLEEQHHGLECKLEEAYQELVNAMQAQSNELKDTRAYNDELEQEMDVLREVTIEW